MNALIDDTHDPSLSSWVESANAPDTDFPIQNLPFGRFRRPGESAWRIGVAIGDHVLDVQRTGLGSFHDVHALLQLAPAARRTLRRQLSQGLSTGKAAQARWRDALVPMAGVELGLPCTIGDYTDFYVGIHHATAVGKLFRPDNPLLPNYQWVPIGYHGRASTICPSGHAFRRPRGQVKPPDATQPALAVTTRLDYELELGIVIGQPSPMGDPVAIERAEDHIVGLTLFNDWSARDIQPWEYQPLGPFLSKNFASTLSPWIVTLEALAPFRKPWQRGPDEPQPLPYLDSAGNREAGAFDVHLEVWLQTEAMRRAGHAGDRLARSNFADAAYWTAGQLVTHHTASGCGLNTGDLLGTGTLSGARPEQAGSLLELTSAGQWPVVLSNGEHRRFLEDGDTVQLRGVCERVGFRRLGFGECRGTVLPARPI